MLPIMIMLFHCRSTEPVLSGIPDDPILQAPPESSTPQKSVAPKPYQRAESIDVDIAYLCGSPLNNVLLELETQLGGFNGEFELPARDGYSRQYDRGEVRHVGGQIYMIRYTLDTPLRRSEALQASGFPEYVEDYISTHREYILNNQWEFRRFRMMKDEERAEYVTSFEAWKWLPAEGE